MRKYATAVSVERLRVLLAYDEASGTFTRSTQTVGRVKKGDVAGHTKANGYVSIRVDNKQYQAHRLAWLYVTGEWPSVDIDHINGDKTDNRIANLRLASPSENLRNRPKNANNSSGLKGVQWHKQRQKWTAQIGHQGRTRHLGMFQTKEDARQAYCAAAFKLHGSFARVE